MNYAVYNSDGGDLRTPQTEAGQSFLRDIDVVSYFMEDLLLHQEIFPIMQFYIAYECE